MGRSSLVSRSPRFWMALAVKSRNVIHLDVLTRTCLVSPRGLVKDRANARTTAIARTMANGSRGCPTIRSSADLARWLAYQVIPAKNPARAFHAAHLDCRWH